MDVEEVENAIDELETRLERLRSLYEQYFLGIEKIEPTVARKDVDRRIWVLRREQIRNTARRFKLQTIIQRYNTFQQYWQRICREIENGTYKRHLLRAEKNFGPEQALTIVARKRFRNRGASAGAVDKALETQSQLAADLGAALEDKSYDPLEEAKRAVDAALGRSDASRASTVAQEHDKRPPSVRGRQRVASDQPRQPLSRLELDLDADFPGGQPASAPAPPASAPARPAAAATARGPSQAAAPVTPGRRATPEAAESTAATPASRPRPVAPARAAPPAARAATPPAQPARPVPHGRPPPDQPPARPLAGAGRPGASPRPRPPARTAGGAGQPGISDARVRELHARLLDARRQTKDGRNISVDGLKKSLQAAESRLRKQHGNRSIDFDVVIKDGRVVVKPIVR